MGSIILLDLLIIVIVLLTFTAALCRPVSQTHSENYGSRERPLFFLFFDALSSRDNDCEKTTYYFVISI